MPSKATLSASEQMSHNHKGNSSEVYFSSNLHLVFLCLFCKLCFESTFPCQQQSRAERRGSSLPPLQGFLAGCLRVSHRRADPAHGWAGGAPSPSSPTCAEPQHLEITCASSEGQKYRCLLLIAMHPITGGACSWFAGEWLAQSELCSWLRLLP